MREGREHVEVLLIFSVCKYNVCNYNIGVLCKDNSGLVGLFVCCGGSRPWSYLQSLFNCSKKMVFMIASQ